MPHDRLRHDAHGTPPQNGAAGTGELIEISGSQGPGAVMVVVGEP
jgi:hypothetical protein